MAAARAVVLGAEYVAGKFFYLVDVLDVSTAAMALERAQHPLKDDAYYKLKSMARHGRPTTNDGQNLRCLWQDIGHSLILS